MSERSVAAVVLAAGRGRRFAPSIKQLARFEGRSLVRIATANAITARLAPVVVVVGHRSSEVRAEIDDLPVVTAHNPDYRAGLSRSITVGLETLPTSCTAAIFLACDQPLLEPVLLARMASAHLNDGAEIVIPRLPDSSRRGSPALFGRSMWPRLRKLDGDRGGGAIIRDTGQVTEVAMTDPSSLIDVDSPAALAALVDSRSALDSANTDVSET